MLGRSAQIQNLAVGYSEAGLNGFLQSGNRRNGRGRTGADEQLGSGVGFAVASNGKALSSLTGDSGGAVYNGNTGSFHFGTNAGNQGVNHLVLAIDNLGMIQRCAGNGNAVCLTVVSVVQDFCRVEKGFGGDTALVQANAAESALLKQKGLHSAVCSTLSSIVSAGAATHNDKIVSHIFPPYFARSRPKFSSARHRSDRKRAAGAPSTARWSKVRDRPIAGYVVPSAFRR